MKKYKFMIKKYLAFLFLMLCAYIIFVIVFSRVSELLETGSTLYVEYLKMLILSMFGLSTLYISMQQINPKIAANYWKEINVAHNSKIKRHGAKRVISGNVFNAVLIILYLGVIPIYGNINVIEFSSAYFYIFIVGLFVSVLLIFLYVYFFGPYKKYKPIILTFYTLGGLMFYSMSIFHSGLLMDSFNKERADLEIKIDVVERVYSGKNCYKSVTFTYKDYNSNYLCLDNISNSLKEQKYKEPNNVATVKARKSYFGTVVDSIRLKI